MITEELRLKLEKKIDEGASFLSCVSLTQKTLSITLKEAKELLLESDVYSDERKKHIVKMINLMQSEYEENYITFNDLKLIDENKPLKNQLNELKEDLYQLNFQNYIIDIGWYPSFSIKGEFKLVVIENENWNDEIIAFKTRNIKELKYILDEITIALNDEDFYRKIIDIKKLIEFRQLITNRKRSSLKKRLKYKK